jgi:subtilisin family serine protease
MYSWINLEEAQQALAEGEGNGISVAVLDSGIEVTHPDLKGMQLVDDLAIVPFGPKLRVIPGHGIDLYGHGTAVAGIIQGLAPRCRFGSIRVLGSNNTSKTEIIQRAAQEAIERGYKILNCSFGCALQSQVLLYKSWVDEAYLKGVHITAACNNDDFRRPEWPAYFPSVISVNMGQMEDAGQFYYRPGTLVEFVAKGVDVKVSWSDGKEKLVTGSSFAAPRLAGLLARLLSVYPDLSPLQAKAIFHRIAKPWQRQFATKNERDSQRNLGVD